MAMLTATLPEATSLPWSEPLHYAAGVTSAEPCWMLYHSGMHTAASGRFSYLCLAEKQRLTDPDWQKLEAMAQEHAVWGYLGYGLKDTLEVLPKDEEDAQQSFASCLPPIWMSHFGLVVVFDHASATVTAYAETKADLGRLPQPQTLTDADAVVAKNVTSNMSKADYEAKLAELLAGIHAGDIYQANLTRKFTGHYEGSNGLALFARLAAISPAPYSAYLKLEDVEVISSSPEQFMRVNAGGVAEARPIKGTAPTRARGCCAGCGAKAHPAMELKRPCGELDDCGFDAQ
jgi:para-aminobenzoate synthetase component 1